MAYMLPPVGRRGAITPNWDPIQGGGFEGDRRQNLREKKRGTLKRVRLSRPERQRLAEGAHILRRAAWSLRQAGKSARALGDSEWSTRCQTEERHLDDQAAVWSRDARHERRWR